MNEDEEDNKKKKKKRRQKTSTLRKQYIKSDINQMSRGMEWHIAF